MSEQKEPGCWWEQEGGGQKDLMSVVRGGLQEGHGQAGYAAAVRLLGPGTFWVWSWGRAPLDVLSPYPLPAVPSSCSIPPSPLLRKLNSMLL